MVMAMVTAALTTIHTIIHTTYIITIRTIATTIVRIITIIIIHIIGRTIIDIITDTIDRTVTIITITTGDIGRALALSVNDHQRPHYLDGQVSARSRRKPPGGRTLGISQRLGFILPSAAGSAAISLVRGPT